MCSPCVGGWVVFKADLPSDSHGATLGGSTPTLSAHLTSDAHGADWRLLRSARTPGEGGSAPATAQRRSAPLVWEGGPQHAHYRQKPATERRRSLQTKETHYRQKPTTDRSPNGSWRQPEEAHYRQKLATDRRSSLQKLATDRRSELQTEARDRQKRRRASQPAPLQHSGRDALARRQRPARGRRQGSTSRGTCSSAPPPRHGPLSPQKIF